MVNFRMVRNQQGTRMEPPSFERRGGNQGAQGWQDEDPLDDTASYAPMILSEILQGEAGVTGEGGRPNQTEGVPPVAAEQARILLSVHRVEPRIRVRAFANQVLVPK
ncbi:hypothetical protein OIU74_012466 [Salix koriyanagi]|uniref:Uncharacterized protein n=1 Tax=Salix koriyanagi TaxID=2511006 RepID=A0A9Q0Q773_9ROSI|nr:hypothetical protein OIU74_012466 [Salix koriyanagi]